MTKGNIAELAAIALSRYSLFLLSIRTIGYRGEQCSGGESGIRTHGTARVVDNPLTSNAGMADRTNFIPETTSLERNERDQTR